MRRTIRTFTLLPLLAGCAVVLAACGGSSHGAKAGSSTAADTKAVTGNGVAVMSTAPAPTAARTSPAPASTPAAAPAPPTAVPVVPTSTKAAAPPALNAPAVAPRQPNFLADGTVNLDAVCQTNYGRGTAKLDAPNAYGWMCYDGAAKLGSLDINAFCKVAMFDTYAAYTKPFDQPFNSWKCLPNPR